MSGPRRTRLRSYKAKIILMIALLVVFGCISLFVGRYSIDPGEVLRMMGTKLTGGEGDWSAAQEQAFFSVRLPRVIMAIAVGAGLSMAGASFQTMFKNPLVSPDILGVSASAGLGAAIGIMVSDAFLGLTGLLAFVFGLVGVACTYLLGRTRTASSTVNLVLAGIVVTALANAGISLMKYLADPLDKLPAITFWLMGSLSSIRWVDVAFGLPIILVCGALLWYFGWRMNLLTMGDAEARSMGIRPERTRKFVIVCATLISAACVCICGAVGWVGLVIPHISRMIVGPDMRKLLPASFLLGGMFLLVVDDITRAAMEASLPLSIVTAFVGAPFFAFLIKRSCGGWE